MPYKSGTWGPEAQERSKRRLDYFHAHNQSRYELNKDEEKEKAAIYYELNREKILENKTNSYSKTDAQLRYQLKKDEIKAKSAIYYKLHREEILRKKAQAYSKKKSIHQ